MATPTKHWKLGLFIMAGLVAGIVALTYFGGSAIRHQTVEYWTYFDQSVEGITVGSPVHLRGITIGRVDDIRIAPDKRMVAVGFGLTVKELRRQGLLGGSREKPALQVTPEMRTRLALTTIVGEQVLAIDFFDPATHPPPPLTFPPPQRYIPATASAFSGIEAVVANLSSQVGPLIAHVNKLVDDGDALMVQLNDARLGERTDQALLGFDRLVGSTRGVVDRTGEAQVPERLGNSLATLDGAIVRLDTLMEHVDSDGGLLPSAQRTSDAIGDVARNSHAAGLRLDSTLREVRDTAAAIRRVTDLLERNPDMLVKGRARQGP